MRKHIRAIIKAVLAVTLVIGLIGSVRQLLDYREGSSSYSDAAALAGVALPEDEAPIPSAVPAPAEPAASEPELPADPYAAALADTDLAALREINGDVLGWFSIPGTDISYPLMQGGDNDYYLKYTWQQRRSSVGAIFVDFRNSADLSDFNTVIYGHRMYDDTMFTQLHDYKEDGFWEEHPCVYIVDDSGVRRYEIFAFYETGTDKTYEIDFSTEADRQLFINTCTEQFDIAEGAVPATSDRIITLSTCTGSGHATRWVVQAMLTGIF